MDQCGSVQHLDRGRQVHQCSRFRNQHTASKQSHARAQPFPACRYQAGESRLERGVHLGQQPGFHLLLLLLDRIHKSEVMFSYCCHIGCFGNNRN